MSTLFSFKSRAHTEFDDLLTQHIEPMYRLAYRLTGKKEDAEDLVQELLLRLYPQVNTMRKVENLKPWLARSLYNLYIDTIRKNNRSPLGHLDGDSENVLPLLEDQNTLPDNQLELSQQQKQLLEAVNLLGEAHRSLVIMHDMEGYTLAELSDSMNLPVGTLKSRLHRARKKLRKSIRMEPNADKQRVICY
jgi:RNA polymerase sigma-70 factor (ECF subfamily)